METEEEIIEYMENQLIYILLPDATPKQRKALKTFIKRLKKQEAEE